MEIKRQKSQITVTFRNAHQLDQALKDFLENQLMQGEVIRSINSDLSDKQINFPITFKLERDPKIIFSDQILKVLGYSISDLDIPKRPSTILKRNNLKDIILVIVYLPWEFEFRTSKFQNRLQFRGYSKKCHENLKSEIGQVLGFDTETLRGFWRMIHEVPHNFGWPRDDNYFGIANALLKITKEHFDKTVTAR